MPKESDTIRVPLVPPVKGVNRAFAEGAQPEGTTFDALNILPIDRSGLAGSGRLRLSTRPGVQINNDFSTALPVRLLHSAIFPQAPPGASLFYEPFTYADGTLCTRPSTLWTCDGVAQPSVVSNEIINNALSSSTRLARITSTVSTGSVYTVRMRLKFQALSSGTSQRGAGIIVRALASASFGSASNDHVRLTVRTDDGTAGSNSQIVLQIPGGSPSASVTALLPKTTTIIANTYFDLELQVEGNTFRGYFNGVLKVTGTQSSLSAQSAIGFTMTDFITSTAGTNNVSIDDFYVFSGIPDPTAITQSTMKLVATSSTKTFLGTPAAMPEVSNDASFPVSASATIVSAATLFGKTYIVDGTQKPLMLDLASQLFVAFVETAGTAPNKATIACNWRGRLVLSGQFTDSQNVFASKMNDPTDWNYAATSVDAAWALNLASQGRVGEPVIALIPMSDDLLIVGCEQSMWLIRGDIADGGSVDMLTNAAGISGVNAWCRGPNGELYWVGPRGFFKCAADGSGIESISRTVYPQFFASVNRATQHVTLVYDSRRFGIWVYVTPEAQSAATSIFYDISFGGFWPTRFTNASAIGPLSAVYWDGFDSDRQYPFLGGYDGKMYRQNETTRSDLTSSVIDSYVVFGPLSLSLIDDATITRLDVTLGAQRAAEVTAVTNADWTVSGGNSANAIFDGTPRVTATGSFTAAGRQSTRYPRVRGGWFSVKFANSTADKYFTYEAGALHVMPSGMQR